MNPIFKTALIAGATIIGKKVVEKLGEYIGTKIVDKLKEYENDI